MAGLQARIGRTRAWIDGDQAPVPDGLTDRELRRALNAAENAELARLYDDGTISQPTRQRLQHGLDLEAARLTDDQHLPTHGFVRRPDLAGWQRRCQAVASAGRPGPEQDRGGGHGGS